MELFGNGTSIFAKTLTGLFYLSPVATASSAFYLEANSNWATFRDGFIIPVILSEPFSSLMQPNVLKSDHTAYYRTARVIGRRCSSAIPTKHHLAFEMQLVNACSFCTPVQTFVQHLALNSSMQHYFSDCSFPSKFFVSFLTEDSCVFIYFCKY